MTGQPTTTWSHERTRTVLRSELVKAGLTPGQIADVLAAAWNIDELLPTTPDHLQES